MNVWHTVQSLPEQCLTVGHTAAEIWGIFLLTGTLTLWLLFLAGHTLSVSWNNSPLTSRWDSPPSSWEDDGNDSTGRRVGDSIRQEVFGRLTAAELKGELPADWTVYKTQHGLTVWWFHAGIKVCMRRVPDTQSVTALYFKKQLNIWTWNVSLKNGIMPYHCWF